MKKIWHIFKEYYLIYTLLCFITFWISYFTYEESNYKLSALIFPMVLFWLILISIGTINLLKYEYFRPKKINHFLNLSPFSNFKMNGFKQINNEFIGEINGYCVTVGIEWESYQKKPVFYFKILFNPLSLKRNLTFDEFINFNDVLLLDDNFFITLNRIENTFSKKELSKIQYKDLLKND